MFGMKISKMFFDSEQVVRFIERRTKSVFIRFGQYVRKVARHSMKKPGKKAVSYMGTVQVGSRSITYTTKSSMPGDPPFVQTGLLKRFIFYGFDVARRSVIIGPEKLSGLVAEHAAESLEYGGESTTWDKGWSAVDGRARSTKVYRRITIRARPYMRPAFAAGMKKLPEFWQQSVQKAG